MEWTAKQVMYDKDVQKDFAALYYKTMGKRVSCDTCASILNTAYFELKKALSLGENFTTMNTSKFILKTGQLITFGGSTFSESFLPEKSAIELLAKYPEKFKHKFKSINQAMVDAYIANGFKHTKGEKTSDHLEDKKELQEPNKEKTEEKTELKTVENQTQTPAKRGRKKSK
jgi:hypothetical protein